MVLEILFICVVHIMNLFESFDWDHEGLGFFGGCPRQLNLVKRLVELQRLYIILLKLLEERIPKLGVISDCQEGGKRGPSRYEIKFEHLVGKDHERRHLRQIFQTLAPPKRFDVLLGQPIQSEPLCIVLRHLFPVILGILFHKNITPK